VGDTINIRALRHRRQEERELRGGERRGRQRLIVSDYVINEAVTLAKARSRARVALRMLDLIEQSVGIRQAVFTTARIST
jgi:predicted nucleic acid-binding protein